MNNEDTQQINPDKITGYIIQRSLDSNFLFDVFAVNSECERIVCVESNISLENAQNKVNAINQEYYPILPTPTEMVSIELRGESKICNNPNTTTLCTPT